MKREGLDWLSYYTQGNYYVVVRRGHPTESTAVGSGGAWLEAVRGLDDTPLQSVGPDAGLSATLEFAEGTHFDEEDGDLDEEEMEEYELDELYSQLVGEEHVRCCSHDLKESEYRCDAFLLKSEMALVTTVPRQHRGTAEAARAWTGLSQSDYVCSTCLPYFDDPKWEHVELDKDEVEEWTANVTVRLEGGRRIEVQTGCTPAKVWAVRTFDEANPDEDEGSDQAFVAENAAGEAAELLAERLQDEELERLAEAVQNADSQQRLLAALVTLRDVCGELSDYGRFDRLVDMPSLQTFGGAKPSSTDGVWSWDEQSVLVGDGYDDLKIQDRSEWAAEEGSES